MVRLKADSAGCRHRRAHGGDLEVAGRRRTSVTKRLRSRVRQLRALRDRARATGIALGRFRRTRSNSMRPSPSCARWRQTSASTEYYAAVAAFLHGDARRSAVAAAAAGDRDRSELRADLRSDRRGLYEARIGLNRRGRPSGNRCRSTRTTAPRTKTSASWS